MTFHSRPKGLWGTLAYLVMHSGWNIIISLVLAGVIVLGIYAYDYMLK